MRRVALAIATAPLARIALARCDNATELAEFYSFCDIVHQLLGRQKRMTISATCLHNDCKREEKGDARIPRHCATGRPPYGTLVLVVRYVFRKVASSRGLPPP